MTMRSAKPGTIGIRILSAVEVLMKKDNYTPTMKDVAREAGVALGTVSKVVNGLPVGEAYKIRVENAIEKLNYQVNSYAQGLKANKTYTAALLIPNTLHPFYASLVYYINQALLKRKYRMLLCATDFDSKQEQEYITMAQQNKVDGIIGLTYNPNLIIEENIPFVAIATILPAGSWRPRSLQISAAKTWLSCAPAHPCPMNQISGKPASKTAAFPAGFLMK